MKGTKQILMGLVLAAGVMLTQAVMAAGPAPIDLGSCSTFAILAGSTITTTGGGIINGDVGLYPAGEQGIPPAQINGTIYNGGPIAAQAQLDLNDAIIAASPAQLPGGIDVGNGELGGRTLAPGVYQSAPGSYGITLVDLTLSGGPDDVWVFQMASTLTVGVGRQVILTGGAQAKNIFWQVGSSATLQTSSVFKGTIMAYASVTMEASSTMDGRALAQIGAVTFNGNGGNVPGLQVSILSPTNGTVFSSPSVVTVLVSAVSVGGGGITNVKVYAGTRWIGASTVAPYRFVWAAPLASNYVLTARAYDASSAVATSTPVNVTVLSTLWDGATDAPGNWRYLSWFGWFNDGWGTGGGWIWHAEHGWLDPFGSSTSSIWLWNPRMGAWLWTSESRYPFVYYQSSSWQSWLWYYRGTGNSNGGWFYNYATGLNEWR